MKSDTRFFFVGVASGTIGALLFLLVSEMFAPAFLFSANIISDTPSVTDTLTPTPTATPSEADFWQRIVIDASPVLASVQAFNASRVSRSGTGVFVSQDGLLATTYDVAPDPALLYQVSLGDRVYRATLVKRDYKKNLSLLYIEDEGFSVGQLSSNNDERSGKDLLVVGKLRQLSGVVIFSQRALLSYATPAEHILDTNRNSHISGAAVLDANGTILGIISLRNSDSVRMIPAGEITEFVDNYLNNERGQP